MMIFHTAYLHPKNRFSVAEHRLIRQAEAGPDEISARIERMESLSEKWKERREKSEELQKRMETEEGYDNQHITDLAERTKRRVENRRAFLDSDLTLKHLPDAEALRLRGTMNKAHDIERRSGRRIEFGLRNGALVVLKGDKGDVENAIQYIENSLRSGIGRSHTTKESADAQRARERMESEAQLSAVAKALRGYDAVRKALEDPTPEAILAVPKEEMENQWPLFRKAAIEAAKLDPRVLETLKRTWPEDEISFIKAINAVAEENLGVIQVLSDDLKKNHMQEYRSLIRDAAAGNPAVLKCIKDEYRDHWLDDSIHPTYGDIVNATFKLDGKKPKEKEAIPMAVYDVSEEWIAASVENRKIFHKHFVDQAAIPHSKVLSELFYARMIPAVIHKTGEPTHVHKEADRRHLLDGYLSGGADTGKQGWAYTVLDVVTDNPAAISDLSQQAIDALKKENPTVYEQIKRAAKKDVISSLDLADPDIVRDLLTGANIGKLSQELLRDSSLIGKIPDEILTDRQNAEAVKTLIIGVAGQFPPNPRLIASIEAWQKDEGIVLDLVRRNANVYPYVAEGFKNNREVIFAALKAEEGRQGNFHWNMVPEDAYRDICAKLRGGDPRVQHFLPYLIDPEYQAPEEEPKYRVIEDFPVGDRNDPIAMGKWLAGHPGDFKHLEKSLREDDYFLRSVLKTTPRVVNFISDENTGMEWKKLWKIAVEEAAFPPIDYSKLTLEATEGIAAYYASLDGKDPIVSLEATFLSRSTLPDKVITEYIAHMKDPERLRKIPVARITTILKNPDLRRTLVADPNTLRAIVRAYPTLIPLMPSSLFEDYGALSGGADAELSTALIASAPERVREIRDESKRNTSGAAYRTHLKTFVLKKPEYAPVISSADETLVRNDGQFLLSLLTDLDNDAKAKNVEAKIHEERQRAVLAAATPEALNAILKEKPELQSLVDETKTLEKAAERGDQTLFLKLLPESGTSVLSAAGKLLDDTAFIRAALNKTPQEDHKLVLWQAKDRVIAALIVNESLTNDDVATVGEYRLEGLLEHLDVKNKPQFFMQVIRMTGRTDLLRRADESVRSNPHVYYELLPNVRSDILTELPDSLKKNASFFLAAYEKVASNTKKAQEIITYAPDETLLSCILHEPSIPGGFIDAVPHWRLRALSRVEDLQNDIQTEKFFLRIIARNDPTFIQFANKTLRANTDFLLRCLEGKGDLRNEENKVFIEKFLKAADLSPEQKKELGEKFRAEYQQEQNPKLETKKLTEEEAKNEEIILQRNAVEWAVNTKSRENIANAAGLDYSKQEGWDDGDYEKYNTEMMRQYRKSMQ